MVFNTIKMFSKVRTNQVSVSLAPDLSHTFPRLISELAGPRIYVRFMYKLQAAMGATLLDGPLEVLSAGVTRCLRASVSIHMAETSPLTATGTEELTMNVNYHFKACCHTFAVVNFAFRKLDV